MAVVPHGLDIGGAWRDATGAMTLQVEEPGTGDEPALPTAAA